MAKEQMQVEERVQVAVQSTETEAISKNDADFRRPAHVR